MKQLSATQWNVTAAVSKLIGRIHVKLDMYCRLQCICKLYNHQTIPQCTDHHNDGSLCFHTDACLPDIQKSWLYRTSNGLPQWSRFSCSGVYFRSDVDRVLEDLLQDVILEFRLFSMEAHWFPPLQLGNRGCSLTCQRVCLIGVILCIMLTFYVQSKNLLGRCRADSGC